MGTRIRILNTYGPAEATIVALSHAVQMNEPIEDEIPIGRPLPGLTAFVLGADREIDLSAAMASSIWAAADWPAAIAAAPISRRSGSFQIRSALSLAAGSIGPATS